MRLTRKKWVRQDHDQELRDLLANGLEDREIASVMGFDVSTVIGKRVWLKLPGNQRPTHPPARARSQPEPPPPKERANPLFVASAWLGSRLVEKPGSGYWLDGRPVSLTTIMRETNRILSDSGAEQIGSNPAWLV